MKAKKSVKRFGSLLLAAVMLIGLAVPIQAEMATPSQMWYVGFDQEGRYTDTVGTRFRFEVDQSVLLHGGNLDFTYEKGAYQEVWSGSVLYVPLSKQVDGGESQYVTDKDVKNFNIVLSHTAVDGKDCIESVELVNGKKEKIGKTKIKELGNATYAKIQFAETYLPLTKTRVGTRLVLSVHGISYQQTAVTFRCYMQNRVELIGRNSVYGALTPAQFHSLDYNGEVTFDFGEGIRHTTRIAPLNRYYLNLDKTMDPALEEMYPDGYLECYNFLGNNDSFPAVGKLQIPISESKFKEKKTKAEVYVYTLKGNTLKAVSLSLVSYDSKNQIITINTDSLENYVLSSRALLKHVDNDQLDILRSGYANDNNVIDPDVEPA